MKVEVFNYTWTYNDESMEPAEEVSSFKVTRKYLDSQKLRSKGVAYRIIEESRDLVDDSMVIDGICYPDIFTHGT